MPVATEAGDVYFYSPEQLTGGEGVPARRNLYAFRDGAVRHVATFDAVKPATRFQVSPDGEHAAFITASQITSYDNTAADGKCTEGSILLPDTGPACTEMYAYDAEADEVTCVSCLPDGSPPDSDVAGSRNGLFMAHDGRTFFTTEDALVPADTNGLPDIYEYSGGRPRLISSGIGTDQTLASEFSAGLYGVSGNGTDVYFITLETLVPQDQNGPFLKMYVARTNGGFPISAEVAPCAAADECHGPGSVAPALPRGGTTSPFGATGNARPTPKAKQRKRCGKRAKKAGKKRCRAGKRSAGKRRVHR
jgi:hypothetical protein